MLFKKIEASGVVCTVLAILFARPIASIFVGYDTALLDMTTRAFSIGAVPFLLMCPAMELH